MNGDHSRVNCGRGTGSPAPTESVTVKQEEVTVTGLVIQGNIYVEATY